MHQQCKDANKTRLPRQKASRYSALIHQQGLVLPQNDLVRMAHSKNDDSDERRRSTFVSESRIECLA